VRHALKLLLILTAAVFSASAGAADLALIHARIYPSPEAEPIADGSVILHAGRIQSVGPSAGIKLPRNVSVIDVHGAVVTAGFWNCHVHLITAPLLKAATHSSAELSAELSQMLTRWGFTTVFDIASPLDNSLLIRRRITAGEVIGPKILTVGDPFYPKNGTPIYVKQFMRDNGFQDEEITDLPKAVARARRQIHAGADGVKLFAGAIVGGDTGVLPMQLDQARALVEAAHRAGKPVFAHPSNLAGLNVSIDSGVDILAHTTPDGGAWSEETTARILAHHMALIPTLTLFEVELKKGHAPDAVLKRFIDIAVQQVSVYSKAGGQILFGTDVGYIDVVDTTQEFTELGRVLDWRQVLAALTVAPAQRFGFAAHKGRVAEGMDADLVVLNADPAQDPAAFAKVRMTLRDARTLYSTN
jgi:imidazolonepropionase-like amidohydrolase